MRTFLIATLLAGCVTMRGQAESAFEHEDYLQAADMFEKIAAANPGDQDAIAKRDASRDGALAQLKKSYALAPSPQTAATDLVELLDHRDAWSRTIDVTSEVEQTGMYITGMVAARTSAAGPLAGEALEQSYAPLLAHADFRDRRDVLTGLISESAHARCDAIETTTPYLTYVVDRYCGHFGVERGDAMPLPGLRGDLQITGDVAGISGAQRADLDATLASTFRTSPWFADGAPVIAGHVDGRVAQAIESHPVTLSAGWTETVSYQEDESSYEPYEETYTDFEQVAVTSQNCDADGCTPTTSYETQSVQKTRTSYHWVTNSVTKYRDEPRIYTYGATQVSATNADDMKLVTPIVEADLDDDFTQSGYDIDDTFTPAGVVPTRANVMTLPALVQRGQTALRAQFATALAQKWSQVYCSGPSYTTEAAAQCIYGARTDGPAAAHTGLATVFGGDEPLVTSVL